MAVYAIGDVQGCLEPLQRLLEHIRFDSGRDRLWFTGDLVNRGPDSLSVLREVRALGDAALTVLGNHDLHLLALAANDSKEPRARDTLAGVLEAEDRDELLAWLRRQPMLHHDVELGYTLIHAGLAPQWDLATARSCASELESVLRGPDYQSFLGEMYGDEPAEWSPGLSGTARLRFITNCFTRLRYCDHSGRLRLGLKGPPEQYGDAIVPWFRAPGRASSGLRIIFGHWSTLGEVRDPDIVALDTGCVWGGQLSALRLDGPGATIRIPC